LWVEPDVGVEESEPMIMTVAPDWLELDAGPAVDDPEAGHKIRDLLQHRPFEGCPDLQVEL
jgi:hypothetical protein